MNKNEKLLELKELKEKKLELKKGLVKIERELSLLTDAEGEKRVDYEEKREEVINLIDLLERAIEELEEDCYYEVDSKEKNDNKMGKALISGLRLIIVISGLITIVNHISEGFSTEKIILETVIFIIFFYLLKED